MKHQNYLMIVLALFLSSHELSSQCPSEVSGLPADLTVNADETCMATIDWVEPEYDITCNDFVGSFDANDPTIWILNTNGENGGASPLPDGSSITFTGSSSGVAGVNTDTDFCINIPFDVTVSFDWDATAIGGGMQLINNEPAMTIDGTETLLNMMGVPPGTGIPNESGSVTDLSLASGQVFCFRVKSNNQAGVTTMIIDNFTFNITEINQTDGPANGSSQGPGDYTIEYTVENCDGTESMCTFIATVADSMPPEITCPDDIVIDLGRDDCEAVVCFMATVTDNCPAMPPSSLPGFDFLGMHNGSSYFASVGFAGALSWEDANTAAAMAGGHLVAISDQAEQDFLEGALSAGLFSQYWIGLRYSEELGDFKWVNGDPLIFDSWGLGQPGIIDGDYVYTWDFFGGFLDGWYDSPAILPRRYIVEISSYDLQLTSGLAPGSNFPTGTTTVTYVASDVAGNTAECSFDVTINEYIPDGLACKTENISLDENCEATLNPYMLLSNDSLGCIDNYEVTVWAPDGVTNLGNTVGQGQIGQTLTYSVCHVPSGLCCDGEITVEDKLPPGPLVCDDVDIACNALSTVPTPISSDNCGGAVLLVEEYHEFLDCDPDYIARVYRKWVARDNAGNESDTCYQTINLLRIDFGAIDFPGSMNLEFSCDGGYPVDENGHPHPDVTGIPTYTGIALWPVIPPNFCNGFVNYKDVVLFESGCHTRIMRTWEVGEWHCGGLVGPQLWVQMIELFDHEGPSITCPSDMTLSTTPTNYGQCTAMIDLPAAAVSDNCNEPVEVDVAYPGGFLDNQNGGEVTLPVGTHMITYTAYDGCYNSSECSFEVTIEDGTQPIIVCEQHTVVSIKQDGRAVVYAESFDDGSYDNCEIDRFEVRRMTDNCGIAENLIWGAHVEFCCADVGEEVMVMLRVYDTSANYNECMVTAIVQDKQTPFFYCPADMTVECTTNFDPDLLGDFFGMAGIMDNCDAPPVSEEADIDIDNCGLGTITRDFTLVDNNGIVQTCQQVITFINSDPLDESGIIWPLHYEGSDFCSIVGTDPEDLPAGFDVPVITEDECDLTGYNYDDSVHTFADGEEACFKILREWTVIDWCQRNSDGTLKTWEYTQVIKVFNTVAPTIDALSTIEVETFDVNCAAAHVDLVATGSDDCTSEEGLNWSYEIDEDRDGDVDYFGLGNDASGLYDIGIYTITWTVHDECGNFVSADQDFEVINAKPPTPICIYGLSTQLVAMDLDGDGDIDTEMVVLAPEYFDGGSNHQCGYAIDLSFSSDPNDDEIMFDCDDIGLDRPVELWVTDENGNQAYCETFIDVLDENGVDFCPELVTANVMGEVRTGGGAEMEEVSVELAGGDLLNMTDESGMYAFEYMPLGGDYTVSPEKNDDVMNGVSTLDLLLMQKHILGLDELEGPLNLISADINHNDEVTAVDLIELRKLILGIYEEFPHNTSWRFIDADHDFAVAADPWAEAIPEVYEIENLNSNMDIDFVGTKIGDVNGSAEAQMMGTEVESRSGNSLILDMSYSEEGTRIGVRSDDINGLEGLQMTLNTGAMMIVGIEGGAMEMKGTNYHIARNNEVRISWHVTGGEAMSEEGEEDLFYIVVKEGEGDLGAIRVTEVRMKAEAYRGGQIEEVRLRTEEDKSEFTLYQNTPNPWSEKTSIGVELPVGGEMTLNVYDQSGKIVYTMKDYKEKGSHTIVIDNKQIGTSGVYRYEVISGKYRAIKKMIVIR